MEAVQRLVSPFMRHRLIINRNGKYLMKYIVYITINLCNGKFYIGVHRTNPETFDGYIGCGIYRANQATKNYTLHKAVRKYGYENFKRTTIKIFPDTEEGCKEAYELESILVNKTLLKSTQVYNTALGGRESSTESLMKTVYMFDLTGNYLRSFKSSREAARYINPENQDNIRQAIKNNCQGQTSSSYGYFWSYTKEFNYNNKCIKPVAQYTISGKFIRTFNSITEAEVSLQLNSIQQAITKKGSAGGYQWRYYEGNNFDIPTLINVKTKNNYFPIIMFDKKGNIIKEFESVKQCILEHSELSASQINKVLNGTIKSHKGFVFKYKDNDIV